MRDTQKDATTIIRRRWPQVIISCWLVVGRGDGKAVMLLRDLNDSFCQEWWKLSPLTRLYRVTPEEEESQANERRLYRAAVQDVNQQRE